MSLEQGNIMGEIINNAKLEIVSVGDAAKAKKIEEQIMGPAREQFAQQKKQADEAKKAEEARKADEAKKPEGDEAKPTEEAKPAEGGPKGGK
jgi:hypothetical protein